MSAVERNSKRGLTFSVLDRIAAEEGTNVEELPPLYDVLDPENLEALLASEGVRVTFTYCGYRVTVSSDETISVVPESDARGRPRDR